MKNKSIDRPSSEEIKQNRSARKRAQRELLKQQKAQGLVASHRVSIPNRVCQFENAEEEQASRQDAAIEQARILRAQLPTLLERLEKIEDLRNPKKIKHKLTVLLIYGILTFVFQRASRREANRTLTRPVFMENLKLLFPDLENIPHHDTLYRLLCDIDVNEIEAAHVDVVRRFIVNKNFRRYLIANSYPIAIDGSQKLVRDSQWCEETLQREVRKEGEDNALQHYVYVLEANLAFHNGMTIPLMSEFLTYPDGDIKNAKQDCEQKAFHRLAGRLRGKFSHLPLMVLLDGLYPNGPIMALCRKMNWDFMIVLQDGSLPSVWEEVEGLKKLQTRNHLMRKWHKRRQHFWWVNDIDYSYGPNGRHRLKLHVVVCEESWEEVAPNSTEVVTKDSRHVWISSRSLNATNVHERCNLGARHRWSGIESSFLVEKRQGYQYEHLFAYNWEAMKGYHYLMRLGHMFNVLAQHASTLVKVVKELGIRGFIHFVIETIAGPWLNAQVVRERVEAPFQLRLC